ncbi:uncharacterized protein LOC130801034 [Amaranthus tricolor]|uniref:uncharacterized protein LOC130801034 n=1 Tax=Amaranthus tricolor TaxID=29722 RepID=UPI00258B04C6|nr:uncharacterized protein LOC130801034 [Amaranthus tricolor]
MEAVSNNDLWLTNNNDGIGSYNDLYVLHRSPLLVDLLKVRAPPINFTVICHHQEATRKDVERAFRVLQARFAIIRKPSLSCDEEKLFDIITSCIIMHNMIVEDERDTCTHYANGREFMRDRPQGQSKGTSGLNDEFECYIEKIVDINQYLANKDDVEDRQTHLSLKDDLVENIWQKFGRNHS